MRDVTHLSITQPALQPTIRNRALASNLHGTRPVLTCIDVYLPLNYLDGVITRLSSHPTFRKSPLTNMHLSTCLPLHPNCLPHPTTWTPLPRPRAWNFGPAPAHVSTLAQVLGSVTPTLHVTGVAL